MSPASPGGAGQSPDHMTPIAAVMFHPTAADLANIATILDFYFEPDVPAHGSLGIRLGLQVAAQLLRPSPVSQPDQEHDQSATVHPCSVTAPDDVAAGGETITVALHGRLGAGKYMVLDKAVWEAGRAAGWPSEFIVVHNRKANRNYVCTSQRPFCSSNNPHPLARMIMGAAPREVVGFVSGDTFDLRKSNLTKMDRPAFNILIKQRGKLPPLTGSAEEPDAGEQADQGVPW